MPLLTTRPLSDASGAAVLISRFLNSVTDAPGYCETMSAATPDTCGVAMLVPLKES